MFYLSDIFYMRLWTKRQITSLIVLSTLLKRIRFIAARTIVALLGAQRLQPGFGRLDKLLQIAFLCIDKTSQVKHAGKQKALTTDTEVDFA